MTRKEMLRQAKIYEGMAAVYTNSAWVLRASAEINRVNADIQKLMHDVKMACADPEGDAKKIPDNALDNLDDQT